MRMAMRSCRNGGICAFGDVAVIQVLQLAERFGRKVFILFQHLVLASSSSSASVYRPVPANRTERTGSLQIVITQHLRVRDRPVNIRHTVHDADTQDFPQSQSYRIIRHAQHLEVLGIKVGDRVGKRGFQPSLFGVECRELHYPCIYDTFHIASVGTARHGIHKLVQMLARRLTSPCSLSTSHRQYDFRVAFRHIRFVHLAVDVTVETTGQG